MDDNDQKNNVDGIKPPESQVSGVDGFVTNPRTDTTTQSTPTYANRSESNEDNSDEAAQAEQQQTPPINHEVENAKLKEQKKGLSVWLVVLLVILFAGAAAAAVYFWQSNQAKSDLDSEKAKTAQAQKDLAAQQQTATQQQIDQLTATNAELTAQISAMQKNLDTQAAYITSLTKVANQLKTTCGSACSSIVIPPVPTLAPTPTPKPSVTPTPAPSVTPTPSATPTPTKTN